MKCTTAFVKKFQLPTLESRRVFLDTTFLYKIVNSYYNISDVLAQINFYTPTIALRRTLLFRPASHRTNLLKFSFLSRSQNFFNTILNEQNLDIFGNFITFRRNLRQLLIDLYMV